MSKIDQKAEEIINKHIIFSMGAGLVPIPVVDAVGVIAVQADMLRQLSEVYSIPFRREAGKSYISAVVGGTMARFGASSLLKLIPGVGSIVGGVTMSAMSGASTYAIGQVFKNHFSMGGTMESFDVNEAKQNYEENLKKGKEVAEQLAKEEKAKKENSNAANDNKGEKQNSMDDVFKKLEKLATLRDSKVITEEDFQTQKQRLLNSI